MKKSILFLMSFMILSVGISYAKTTTNSSLAPAIKLYKSGDYVLSYETFSNIVKNDPSNAVAYYYLAMSSAQLGRRGDAISNYSKVIELSTNRQLTRYAKKGIRCIENPEKCNAPDYDENETDKFINAFYYNGFSKEAQSEYEKKKIENIMREMNRKDDIAPVRFREYKDFSSEVPTNDEIVTALRVLQRAGFNGILGNGYNTDLSAMANSGDMQFLQMLTGNNKNLSPQVIQSLLTNQLSTGF